MSRRDVTKLSLAICCMGVAPAYADVTFHGFGQIVVGSTLSNNHTTYPYLSYTADPNFTPESLFALQVQAPLADRLTATAQIVASGANNFSPQFEWAYVNYEISDAWSVKLGRFRNPLYAYSDYFEVGQAYPWIRPPSAVYIPIFNNEDGISLSGYYELGNWTLQPQFVYGTSDNVSPADIGEDAGTYKFVTGLANVNVSYSNWLSFRAQGSYGKATVDVTALDSTLAELNTACKELFPLAPQGETSPYYGCSEPAATAQEALETIKPASLSAVEGRISANDDPVIFYSAGLEIHKYNFILMAEAIENRFDGTTLPRVHAFYGSLGYKWRDLTPLLTVGHNDAASSNPGIAGEAKGKAIITGQTADLSGVGFGPYTAIGLDAPTVIGAIVGGERELQDWYEFTLRYDTSKNTALKLDYTRFLEHAGDYTSLNPTTGAPFVTNNRTGTSLLSAAFVFVF